MHKSLTMGRVLAIDYGRKRTGLAVSDPQRIIATALQTVPSHQLIQFLNNYTLSQQVDCIVIGEPKQMNNTPSEAVVYIEPFIKQLKKNFPDIPVVRVDERFTSLIATQAIAQAGLRRKQRRDKTLVDQVSAVLILQSYLEMMQNKKIAEK
ncbi:MAG TPA: Holliday junction resolvase RuvX [Bacteroidales bacterium]|nr:Holliday junction resolvase RuvX [Bacteroidales bacterium]